MPPLSKGVGTKLHKRNFYRLLRKLVAVVGFNKQAIRTNQ